MTTLLTISLGAATIGMESTLSVQVGIPEVAEVTSSLTIKAEVTNTLSST